MRAFRRAPCGFVRAPGDSRPIELLEPLGDNISEMQMEVVLAKAQVEARDWELRR